jgi:hypothetical protein
MRSFALLTLACALVAMPVAVGAAPKKPERSRPSAPAAREAAPVTKPVAPTGVTYVLKDIVKAKGSEFCSGYGLDAGCLEEIEICLGMVDRDGDPVRMCVNTLLEEDGEARTVRAKAR